jgi:Helix-turn-helix domain
LNAIISVYGVVVIGGRVMKVTQAYRFALDPTPGQERALRSHAGASRSAWNWALAKCTERHEAEGRWYSGAELHKMWNAAKKADPALAWWGENSKCACQEAFRDLDRALRDFVRSGKGQRKTPQGLCCQIWLPGELPVEGLREGMLTLPSGCGAGWLR